MKQFKVRVVTTFIYEDTVEADTPEEAKKIMEAAIDEGEVDAVLDTDDFETEVEVVPDEEPEEEEEDEDSPSDKPIIPNSALRW